MWFGFRVQNIVAHPPTQIFGCAVSKSDLSFHALFMRLVGISLNASCVLLLVSHSRAITVDKLSRVAQSVAL